MFFPNHDTNQHDVNTSSETGSVDFQAESSISQTKKEEPMEEQESTQTTIDNLSSNEIENTQPSKV